MDTTKGSSCKERMKHLKMCALIPTFNHCATLKQVIESVMDYTSDIIVVDDGSTDLTKEILSPFEGQINIISYPANRGKGFALKQGFEKALQLQFDYAITIDSDGQHFASDMPLFAECIEHHPDSLIIGSRELQQVEMNQKSRFANKFSNFWFTVQTGLNLPDTQTGFRVYPLKKMRNMRPLTYRYEAELELLVRCAWRNIKIAPLPIRVYYPPQKERISHFRPTKDFFRISVMNTIFVVLAIIYGYPSIFVRKIFTR